MDQVKMDDTLPNAVMFKVAELLRCYAETLCWETRTDDAITYSRWDDEIND